MKYSKERFFHSFCRLVACSVILLSASHAVAVTDKLYNKADSTIWLDDISVTAIKQGLDISSMPLSSTSLSQKNLERFNIHSIKEVSDIAPNFYMPDYGSRITSSIYVRGMGTRIDQPVIGLNIDNVPIMDKNNYDFDLADIDRIEILRGPQSTLFGRNTMGGIINIYTISPFSFQGIRSLIEYSSGNSLKASISAYHRPSNQLALALVVSGNHSDGFFRNEYNGKKCDIEKQIASRLKLQWRPSTSLSIDNVISFSALHQGGYPYEYAGTGKIDYNDTCFYNRTSLTDGVTINWKLPKFTISSISSYQYIDDKMTLDQDFLPLPYFTLTQARKVHAATQDFILKGLKGNHYKWLVGMFGFYKHIDMDAPVTFKNDGIAHLIEEKRNEANPFYIINWDSRQFVLSSHFTNPDYGLALYHQSTYTASRWTLVAGVRADFEHTSLNYLSACNTGYSTINTTSGATVSHTDVNIDEPGSLHKSFLQILPKFSAVYNLSLPSPSNIFFSISKGYKAGGFNTQMFSDVLQQRIMGVMGLSMNYKVNDIVGYKPERSWNFEAGSHIECFNRRIQTDISAFYIDCTNQQLTVFPDGTTTGRIMTNAGHTRSFGAEAAIKYLITNNIELNLSYGYTNAKFISYNNGKTDFAGKYLPYAPINTAFAGISYAIPIDKEWLEFITFTANMHGVGDIYWNEGNSARQSFYTLLGGSIRFEALHYSLDLWCQNANDASYKTFYFVSMSNNFYQRGKPRQLGVTFRIKI